MTSKLIDIPENASPEGRMIMQAINQLWCLIDERFDRIVTTEECLRSQAYCKLAREKERENLGGNMRANIALIISALTLLGGLLGFIIGG